MYGSENWSLNRSDKRKIEAAEMRFLRPMTGYTLWDKKRSSEIREQLYIFNQSSAYDFISRHAVAVMHSSQ